MGTIYGYIYKHTSPSGKGYIGQTTRSPEKRWVGGRGYISANGRKVRLMAKAIEKYGWENIRHEILWEGELNSIDELNQLEELFIIKEGTLSPGGYNLRTGGQNHLLSDESREKIRKSATGRTHQGHPHSEETKRKISLANKGKKLSPEHLAKLTASHTGKIGTMRGKKHSLETREKMRGRIPWNKGFDHLPPEVRERVAEASRGRKLTEEHKQRISEANRKIKWFNNGVINRRSETCPGGFIAGRLPFSRKKRGKL